MVSHHPVVNCIPITVYPCCVLFLNSLCSVCVSCVAFVSPVSFEPAFSFINLSHPGHHTEEFCKNLYDVHILLIYVSFSALLVFKNYPLPFSHPQGERHRAFSRDQQEQVYRLHPGKVSVWAYSLSQLSSAQLNSCFSEIP